MPAESEAINLYIVNLMPNPSIRKNIFEFNEIESREVYFHLS